MPPKPTQFLLLCVLFTLSQRTLLAQSDTTTLHQSFLALNEHFHNTLGPASHIYTGQEYIRNGQRTEGNAFFGNAGNDTSAVFYDGALYTDISLEYDLVTDQLVVENYTHSASIQLVKEKIPYFTIGTHLFISLEADKTIPAGGQPGFYEQIFSSGDISVYARREKRLVFPSRPEDLPRYRQNDDYYIATKEGFHRIEGQHDLLKTLKDKKDQLKKFIADNKLRFGQQLEPSLVRIASYYARLKN